MTKVTLHVGTYTAGGGRGLCRVDYDPDTGFVGQEPNGDAANASFGAYSQTHGLHYLVDEQTAGMLGVLRLCEDGWKRLALVSSQGRDPCYVALAPGDRRIAIANYGSGSIALFELTAAGLPTGEVDVWANHGSGPNVDRQEGAHIHCVLFSEDGQWLYAVDLGTDQLLRFPVGDGVSLSAPEVAWQAPPGWGPRHLRFHPVNPLALLVSELASTLTLFDATSHPFKVHTQLSTLPPGYSGESLGGHVEFNRAGDRVYVTNRGHDSIAVLALDYDAATLEPIQHIASEGASPRFFLLLEDVGRLILVNEEAGNLAAFAIKEDGRLAQTGHVINVAGAAFALTASAAN